MLLWRIICSFVAVCMLSTLSAALLADEADEESGKTAKAYFAAQIEPILVGRCLECHGEAKKGGLDLRTRAAALVGGDSGAVLAPGKPEESLLFEHVSTGEMPPKNRLTKEQVAAIKQWISSGAYFPLEPLDPFAITNDRRAGYDWWSLQPLSKAEPPDVPEAEARWRRRPLDRFVIKKLRAAGLVPSAPADPRTLLRRATYDLTGLPPTPEEVANFLAACATETGKPDVLGEEAYAALVDRLLASPRYGEQWGRHWLDVVRFGESNGFERNVIITNAWPFRDYVIRSLNDDKPFDRLVIEHLAGDVVGRQDGEGQVGTTFLVCGPYDNVGNQDPVQARQIRADTIDEMIRTTSEAFLGITVGCSRCHDHKFDPISQRDYYSLYATLAGVQHGERTVSLPTDKSQRERIDELAQEIKAIEQQLESLEPLASRSRTIVLDDEAPEGKDFRLRSVTVLNTPAGIGVNPAGAQRGFRDDPGDAERIGNASGGQYRWWRNETAGADLLAWNVAAEGRYRVWLSWGCGWQTHTNDAQYLLDEDGDLGTRDDQRPIAIVDQRSFAGGGPDPLPQVPLWSGFRDAGIHTFRSTSRILLRGGQTGEAVTADVIVLEEVAETDPPGEAQRKPKQPRLRASVDSRINVERFEPVRAKRVRMTIRATNSSEPCLDELEIYAVADEGRPPRNVALASAGAKATSSGDYVGNPIHQLVHVNDGQYGNSQSWISRQIGEGWVQIEFPQVETINRIVWGRDRLLQFRDRLATNYTIEVAEDGGPWRLVASSADRAPYRSNSPSGPWFPLTSLSDNDRAAAGPLVERLADLRKEVAQLEAATDRRWWVGNFEQVGGPFHVFLGGSPERKGAEVLPRSLSTLARATRGYELSANGPESERRLALAHWIVSPDNPLTPRVLANRLWHYHFGAGIVDTPSDFGFMGGRPTHPELLDWLARRLQEEGWRLKPLHREIMLSETYRQAGTWREDMARVDGASRLLWRFPPRRLDAEELRDTMIAAAGKLDLKSGGPGFRLFEYVQDNVATYVPLEVHGPETYRRAVYHHNARAMRVDLLSDFDMPDCAFSTPRRTSTTNPLQALTLLNHQFTLDIAGHFAERVWRDVGKEDKDAQVRRVFSIAFLRSPSNEELAEALILVEKHGLRALCRAILNANELLQVD